MLLVVEVQQWVLWLQLRWQAQAQAVADAGCTSGCSKLREVVAVMPCSTCVLTYGSHICQDKLYVFVLHKFVEVLLFKSSLLKSCYGELNVCSAEICWVVQELFAEELW